MNSGHLSGVKLTLSSIPTSLSLSHILSPIWEDHTSDTKIVDVLLAVAFQQITKHWKDVTNVSFQAWWYAVCYHRLDTACVHPIHLAMKSSIIWSPVTLFIDSSAKRSFSLTPA